jgi:membrane-bound lytic murein transglycosylase A
MAARRGVLVVVLLLAAAGGFWLWWTTRAPPPGRIVLTPTSFADLAGWNQSDPRDALVAFRRSCEALGKLPATRAMGGVGYAGDVGDWQGACSALPSSTSSVRSARNYFETWFAAVAVGGEGLFTGYYEPELRASRSRHGAFQTPIYGLPADLVSVDLGLFRPELSGEHIEGQLAGHRLLPYPSRAQIDAHGVQAAALFYAEDPIAVFFLHVQGSGRARLEDGTSARIVYAGQNGRPYTPVGRTLIEQGALLRDEVSLQAIRAWLQNHPDQRQEILESDQSFVFFQEKPIGDPALGSEGSEAVALTPGASLAVDPHLHPLGAPFYVATTTADTDAGKTVPLLQRLLIAQDTGGAIKGAVRGDVFWGFGPRAEDMAGRMTSRGRFYALLPKPVAARLAPRTEYKVAAR